MITSQYGHRITTFQEENVGTTFIYFKLFISKNPSTRKIDNPPLMSQCSKFRDSPVKSEVPWGQVHSRKDLDGQYHPALIIAAQLSRAPHLCIVGDTRMCPGALCPFPCSRLPTLSVLDPCSLLFFSTIFVMLLVSHSESVLTFSGTSFIFHAHCKLEFQDLFQVVILVLLRRVLIYEPPTLIGVF